MIQSIINLVKSIFKTPRRVRVKKYDGSWITLRVIKTEHGDFVNYLDEVGRLKTGGEIDTQKFLIEWRPYN